MDEIVMYWLVGMLIHGVLFGFVCKYLASQKHKDPGTWFAIGFLLGFIGLIVIAASKDESNTAKAQISNDKSIKKQYKALNPTTNLNSPIDIIENQVHIDDADRVFVTCKMKNISDKVLNSIIITIECFNSFGEAVNESGSNKMEHTIQDLSIKPNGIIGDGIHIHLSNYPATRKVNVIVESVMFEDGEIWKKDINDIIPVSIQSIDNDKLSELKSIAGKDAVFYAKSTDLSWDCVCGRTNRNSQSECSRCLRNKQETLENYSEEGINKKVIKIQEDKMLEKARQEQKLKDKKEKSKKLILSLISVTLIIIVGFFVKTEIIEPRANYKKANQLLADGLEADAFVLFYELGDYKDSEDMTAQLLYSYVVDLKKNNKFMLEPEMFNSFVSVKIPEGETQIYPNAFHGWSNLTKVEIPDSVTEIGQGAFFECVSLEEVKLPKGVSKIESNAFYGCKNLRKVEMPDSMTEIGDGAFYECISLEDIKIPEGLNKIDTGTFYKCKNLNKAEIPDSVTEIGFDAFYECISLEEIIIPEAVRIINMHAFANCNNLNKVEIPDSVTEIGLGVFFGCKNLTIYGSKGSTAEEYADFRDIKFIAQ